MNGATKDAAATQEHAEELRRARTLIRDIPDFPKAGILFRDVTPLLKDARALRAVVKGLAAPWRGRIDAVAGMESRGFIFGALLADQLDVGFIPVRKLGKLPYKTESISYGLEYGSDHLEVHIDACPHRERVLISDDLIATGGTAAATANLIERIGGQVAGYSFVIELKELKGRHRLAADVPVEVLFDL